MYVCLLFYFIIYLTDWPILHRSFGDWFINSVSKILQKIHFKMHVHYVYPLPLSRSFSSPLSVHTSHVLQRFLVLPPVPVHFVPPLSLSNAHLLSLSLPNVCFVVVVVAIINMYICRAEKSARLKWSFRVFFQILLHFLNTTVRPCTAPLQSVHIHSNGWLLFEWG